MKIWTKYEDWHHNFLKKLLQREFHLWASGFFQTFRPSYLFNYVFLVMFNLILIYLSFDNFFGLNLSRSPIYYLIFISQILIYFYFMFLLLTNIPNLGLEYPSHNTGIGLSKIFLNIYSPINESITIVFLILKNLLTLFSILSFLYVNSLYFKENAEIYFQYSEAEMNIGFYLIAQKDPSKVLEEGKKNFSRIQLKEFKNAYLQLHRDYGGPALDSGLFRAKRLFYSLPIYLFEKKKFLLHFIYLSAFFSILLYNSIKTAGAFLGENSGDFGVFFLVMSLGGAFSLYKNLLFPESTFYVLQYSFLLIFILIFLFRKQTKSLYAIFYISFPVYLSFIINLILDKLLPKLSLLNISFEFILINLFAWLLCNYITKKELERMIFMPPS